MNVNLLESVFRGLKSARFQNKWGKTRDRFLPGSKFIVSDLLDVRDEIKPSYLDQFAKACKKPSVPDATYDFRDLCKVDTGNTELKITIDDAVNVRRGYALDALRKCYDSTKNRTSAALVVHRVPATGSDVVELLNFIANAEPQVQQVDAALRDAARQKQIRAFLTGNYVASETVVCLTRTGRDERILLPNATAQKKYGLISAVTHWTGVKLRFNSYPDSPEGEKQVYVMAQTLKTWLDMKGRVAFLVVHYDTKQCEYLQVQLICSAPHAPVGIGALLHLMFLDAVKSVKADTRVVLEVANPGLDACAQASESVAVQYGAGEKSNLPLLNYYKRLGYVRLDSRLECFDEEYPYTNMRVDLRQYREETALALTDPQVRLDGETGVLYFPDGTRSETSQSRTRCAGTTQKGNLCMRYPVTGSKYCSSHGTQLVSNS